MAVGTASYADYLVFCSHRVFLVTASCIVQERAIHPSPTSYLFVVLLYRHVTSRHVSSRQWKCIYSTVRNRSNGFKYRNKRGGENKAQAPINSSLRLLLEQVKLCRRVDKQTGEEELVAVKVFNKSLLNRQARGFAFGRRKKNVKVLKLTTDARVCVFVLFCIRYMFYVRAVVHEKNRTAVTVGPDWYSLTGHIVLWPQTLLVSLHRSCSFLLHL